MLLSDEVLETVSDLAGRAAEDPALAQRLAQVLAAAVPSQTDIVTDVRTALFEELAATAVGGVVTADSDTWPLAVPDLDTRAAVVLWCRGHRPSGPHHPAHAT